MADSSTVLGLDLGANSIGWALLEFEGEDPKSVLAAGVRIFEAGTDGSIQMGLDESRGVQRRQARQRRRQSKRQSWRVCKLAELLRDHGLLPDGDMRTGATRHTLISALDSQLRAELLGDGITDSSIEQLPYLLRMRALDHPLSPHAFGRALFHLAMRRGYKSNRKSDKDDKESGVVDKGIQTIRSAMDDTGARTLGEYFARTNPLEKRIRQRWTARDMYIDEFERMWAAQAPHHPSLLTDELRKRVDERIFFQRPLKSQKGLVGKCEVEPTQRRAAKALLLCQRFRILQKINDLIIHFSDATQRPLTPEERAAVLRKMDSTEEYTFKQMRKLLKLSDDAEFNLERGGETRLKGNVTATRMRKFFGPAWDALPEHDQQRVVGEVLGIDNPETLARRAQEVWGLDAESAARFSRIRLEEGYSALSKVALKQIVPRMEDGTPFMTAREAAYGLGWTKNVLDKLPPVCPSRRYENDPATGKRVEVWTHPYSIDLGIRNPVVTRTLTELRKLVNQLLREHGKPAIIRLELARDLKKSRENRQRDWKKNREREGERKKAVKDIEGAIGNPQPKPPQIQRYLLWKECCGVCPYTGRNISLGSLLADDSPWDIEHIIPFSRCLDDSFANKTLCYHEENRNVKRNQTPYEAYGQQGAAWEHMIERVRRFQGDLARTKLERFQMQSLESIDGFITQKLNDTRYASRVAAKYLAWLYGPEANSRIQVNTGGVTAMLRDAWALNGILSDGDCKTRDDHRHHAVDAIAIALTSRRMVKFLSNAVERQLIDKGRSRGWWKLVEEPWPGFHDDVRAAVERIVVSHRVNRRVRGRLHEDTNYSKPRLDEDGKPYVVTRKPLGDKFSEADAKNIEDPKVREIVLAWLGRFGNDPKKAFGDPNCYPTLTGRDGREVPIHRVRIRKKEPVFAVGQGEATRHVTVDSNHHVAIYETRDKKGNIKWDGEVVSLFKAVQRVHLGKPAVAKDSGVFLYSLSKGDCVELDVPLVGGDVRREIYIVKTFSAEADGRKRITFNHARDAAQDTKETKIVIDTPDRLRICRRFRLTPEQLRTTNAIKVTVQPDGRVIPAHD